MNARIVDTTLRDGEQTAGIALGADDKVKIAGLLDRMGIYQIEAGIPAMGGEEKKSVGRIAELGLKSRVSAWNRTDLGDIRHSMDCGVDIIHISVPSSDIQIRSKLRKDSKWLLEQLRRCVGFIREKGFQVTVGLEDASRADSGFLLQLSAVALLEGACRIRYADTVGVLYRQRAYDAMVKIRENLNIELEMHAHNDLGMAVANSVAAVRGGAEYVDCTIGGIGERAGNCSCVQFIAAARAHLGMYREVDMENIMEVQEDIMRIMGMGGGLS